MMSKQSQERLQKYLARAGVSSRRSAEKLIVAGKVSVNGRVVTELGSKITPGEDEVLVEGKKVLPEASRLFLFHKPADVLTTMRDPQGRKCIGDFVEVVAERVFPVGRLDRDVTGLLLLTNDGELAQSLLHPRYEVPRVYWAVVRGCPGPSTLEQLDEGVELEWGRSKAKRAQLIEPSERSAVLFGKLPEGMSIIEITVGEGKKHFVKKILHAVGFPVEKLCRIAFGQYQLGELKPGEMQEIELG